jgi:hypothetical protein
MDSPPAPASTSSTGAAAASVQDEALAAALIYQALLRGDGASTYPLASAYPHAAALAHAHASQDAAHRFGYPSAYAPGYVPAAYAGAEPQQPRRALLARVEPWAVAVRCGQATEFALRLAVMVLANFIVYRVGLSLWAPSGGRSLLEQAASVLMNEGRVGAWMESAWGLLVLIERSLVDYYLFEAVGAGERGPLFWAVGGTFAGMAAAVIIVRVAKISGMIFGLFFALVGNALLWATGGVGCEIVEEACEYCATGAQSLNVR